MSISKKKNEQNVAHCKYISRITKTLYYGKFPKPDCLSLPVTELASELFSEAHRGRSIDRLHYDNAAKIARNACVSPCSLVIAILYLERLKNTNPEFLERTASSDLFLISLMVSCKFLYDDGEIDEVFVDEWALTGGTTTNRLVQLEKNFLKAIDWEVFVNELTFWAKLDEIEKKLARKQGLLRGYFTYTELQTLLATLQLQSLIQDVLTISTILIAAYAAGLLALFGSAFIVSNIPGTYLQQRKADVKQENVIPVLFDVLPLSVNETDIKLARYQSDKFGKEKVIFDTTPMNDFCVLLGHHNFSQPVSTESETKGNLQLPLYWWNVILKWLSETYVSIKQNGDPKIDLLCLNDLYGNNFQELFSSDDTLYKPINVRVGMNTLEKLNSRPDGSFNKYFRQNIR